MIRKEERNRNQKEEFCVEDFVPADHLLRRIEQTVDFSYIYELVKDCTANVFVFLFSEFSFFTFLSA